MAVWRFLDYCSEAGNNLIEEWYSGLPDEAQADFDVVLKNLSIMSDWRGLSEFRMLGGQYSGLSEIRFKSGKVQYRPIGRFSGEKTFTILVGCSKKQKVYKPPDAFGLALKRRNLLSRGRATLRERFV